MTGEEKKGKVYLVGAGPGDPELITVKGQRLLQECDCLVYDRLAGEELLGLVGDGCERIYVGKQPGSHYRKQEEINQILTECAGRHEITVRLKGGDPFVFGRGGEEIEALTEAGIAYEVVPGVTSAIAVPECAGIPVTHRGLARSFHVVTGHTMEKEGIAGIDFKNLAGQEGTLIFLMGVSHLEEIAEKLMAYGKDPDTPAAVISEGTTPAQREVRGTLCTIARQAGTEGLHAPAVILIGETAALRYRSEPAEKDLRKKLPQDKDGPAGPQQWREPASRTVGVTATASLFSKLKRGFAEKGIEARLVCEMKVVPQKNGMDQLKELFQDDRLSDYTWTVFTSQNAVKVFFEKFQEEKGDAAVFSGMKFAVLGSGTQKALRAYLTGIKKNLRPDFIPSAYTVHDFCREFAGMLTGQDLVLVPRARQGSRELTDMLEQSPAAYTYVEAYDVEGHATEQMSCLGEMSCLVFASASGAEAFMREAMAEPEQRISLFLAEQKTVCIGKVTEQKLLEYGVRADAVASVHTAEGLVSAVKNILKERNSYVQNEKTAGQ